MTSVKATRQRIAFIRAWQALHEQQEATAAKTVAPLPPLLNPSRALLAPNQGRGRWSVLLTPRAANMSSGRARRHAEVWAEDSGTPGFGRLRYRQHKVVPPIPANVPGENQILAEKPRRKMFVEMPLIEVKREIRRLKKLNRRLAKAPADDTAAQAARLGLQQRLAFLMWIQRD